jgi:predicted transcriptional regulator
MRKPLMIDGALLLSIQPEYANKIFDGSKKLELRRIRPKLERGDWVLVYVSAPVKALVGAFQVEGMVERNPSRLWREFSREVGITREEFESYYSGASTAYGILLGVVRRFRTPIELSLLRELWSGFHPPQGFRYLTRADTDLLKGLRHRQVT